MWHKSMARFNNTLSVGILIIIMFLMSTKCNIVKNDNWKKKLSTTFLTTTNILLTNIDKKTINICMSTNRQNANTKD